MKKTLQTGNGIAFLVVIIVNYLSNTGVFNGNTMSSVSAEYHNLFTPAGYAFSIWILIYIGLAAFIFYQGRSLFNEEANDKIVSDIGWWFILSCIANCLWIITWLNYLTALSILIMIFLLFSLFKIAVNTNMEIDDAPMKKIAFVWWPFSLYSGWITVALFANIAAYLTKSGWQGWETSQVSWTIIMILITGIINLAITWTRNMREFALVGVWALVAIAVSNWGEVQAVVYTALTVAAVLFVSSMIHGFKNRKSFPLWN